MANSTLSDYPASPVSSNPEGPSRRVLEFLKSYSKAVCIHSSEHLNTTVKWIAN